MDDQKIKPEDTTSSNDAVLLSKIEEMIKVHISQIDQLQEDISKHQDMVNDIFTNDQTFQEHDKIAKEAARIRSKTKQEIMKKPDVADVSGKLKDLKSEKKDLQDGLSDYLREYQRLSGSNEIEGEDGQVRQIISIQKLVRKSSFRPA